MNRRIVVWLTASAEHEAEFNRWYEQEYIPRFVQQIPGIQHVTRWKAEDALTYITEYELTPGADFAEVTRALKAPDRDADRAAWTEHEGRLPDFRDGFFAQVFDYQPSAGAPA